MWIPESGGSDEMGNPISVNAGYLDYKDAKMDPDSVLDSFVFLDNFRWGCEGGLPPTTIPIP